MKYTLIILCIALIASAQQEDTTNYQQTLGIEKINKVYDGDTFYGDLYSLPPVFGKNIGIRLIGIDTPELNSKDSCERVLAKAAREYLSKVLSSACQIKLKNVSRDKYFRLDAIVFADTTNVNQLMIAKGYAKPYTGEGPKPTYPCSNK